jgi:hypothetical protein
LSPKDGLSPANALSNTDYSPNKTDQHSGYTSKNNESPGPHHREFKFDVGDNKIEIEENPSPKKNDNTPVNFSEAV